MPPHSWKGKIYLPHTLLFENPTSEGRIIKMLPLEKTDCTYMRHRTGACLAMANNNRRLPPWTTWADKTFRMTQNTTFTRPEADALSPPSRLGKELREVSVLGSELGAHASSDGKRGTNLAYRLPEDESKPTTPKDYHLGQRGAYPAHDRRRPPPPATIKSKS